MNWINATERKPEPNALVLCWVVNKYFGAYAMCGQWYAEHGGSWMLDDGEAEGDVTHWMPTPDAPDAGIPVSNRLANAKDETRPPNT